METKSVLVYAAIITFAIILFPIIQASINDTDMAAWTFAGHEGVAAFLTVFPYIFLIATIMLPIYAIMKEKL